MPNPIVNRRIVLGGASLPYLLETTHDAASISPSVAVSAGAPTVQWTVIESDGQVYNYTGSPLNHTRQTAGAFTVRLGPASLGPYVTQVNYGSANQGTVVTPSDVSRMPNLASFVLSGALSAVNVPLASWPDGIETVKTDNTDAVFTTQISDMPASMVSYRVYDSSDIELLGALSDLPAGFDASLQISGTASVVTGGATPIAATGIRFIFLDRLGYSESQVDEVIDRIYADRALFTDASPRLNIHGNNAAPSGTYQYAATPSTGKEKIYALVNDDDAEGFNTWTINYTA